MPNNIFGGVKEYYNKNFKYDTKLVHGSDFFYQLKPRLQKWVLDTIFKNFINDSKGIFGEIDMGF